MTVFLVTFFTSKTIALSTLLILEVAPSWNIIYTSSDFLCDELLELLCLHVIGLHLEDTVNTVLSLLKLLDDKADSFYTIMRYTWTSKQRMFGTSYSLNKEVFQRLLFYSVTLKCGHPEIRTCRFNFVSIRTILFQSGHLSIRTLFLGPKAGVHGIDHLLLTGFPSFRSGLYRRFTAALFYQTVDLLWQYNTYLLQLTSNL